MRQGKGRSGPASIWRYRNQRARKPCRVTGGVTGDAIAILTYVAYMLLASVVAVLVGIYIGRRSWDDLVGPVLLAVAQWCGIYLLKKH